MSQQKNAIERLLRYVPTESHEHHCSYFFPTGDEDDCNCGVEERRADAAAVDALYQATKTGLHAPPDGVGPEGITVHRWEPGHPMGCPICIALDRVEGDDA